MAAEVSTAVDAKMVARLLRGLAIDVETNPTLAAHVIDALAGAGLLDDETVGELSGIHPAPSMPDEDAEFPAPVPVTPPTPIPSGPLSPSATIPPSALMSFHAAKIDLLTLYRVGGAEQVRERLAVLDLAALRRIIQVQELDPSKKTTKLRSTTKIIDHIIERVGAQVEHELAMAKTNSWML